MKILIVVTRIVFGLLLFVSALLYFLKLMPAQPLPDNAQTFITGLFASGYMMPFVKVVELLTGAALIVNRFVSAATLIIFPITLNIFLFNTVLAPSGMIIGIIVLVANIFLAFAYRKNYASVFTV